MSINYAMAQAKRARVSDTPRGRDRFQEWKDVVFQMRAGVLRVGSRTPIAGFPAFLTPVVLKGGFTSGKLVAGGELLPFELKLLREHDLSAPPITEGQYPFLGTPNREQLNIWFLGDDGMAMLRELLESGKYCITVPEEAALLSVALMVENGDVAEATAVVERLAPWFAGARFYPRPSSRPTPDGLRCHRETVEHCLRLIERERPTKASLRYSRTKLSTEVLLPAYDDLLALVLATCEVKDGGDGKGLRFVPFRKDISRGMRDAFDSLAERFDDIGRKSSTVDAKRNNNPLGQLSKKRNCGKVLSAARKFFQLDGGKGLTRREISLVGEILRQVRDSSKRGLPAVWSETSESPQVECKLLSFRQRQQVLVRADPQCTTPEWKRLSETRLVEGVGGNLNAGLDDVGLTLAPVKRSESLETNGMLAEGATFPLVIVRFARLATVGTISELLDADLIPNMEVLAGLCDQLVGPAAVHGLGDSKLRRLFSASSTAFRRRRSLLLLNLESQVRFEELPWMHALNEARKAATEATADASLRGCLAEITSLCITKWPHVMIPNKMCTALDTLATACSVPPGGSPWLRLLPELAADIFMYTFQSRWLRHAAVLSQQDSAAPVSGLYNAYYGHPRGDTLTGSARLWDGLPSVDEIEASKSDPAAGLEFLRRFKQRCANTLGMTSWTEDTGYFVIKNGRMIEASMILTGHNYPALFALLENLQHELPSSQELLLAAALHCFRSLDTEARSARESCDRRARLKGAKAAAYGWRQLVYLVSRLERESARIFFEKALEAELSRMRSNSPSPLERPLLDLRSAWRIVSGEAVADDQRYWKPLVGWTHGKPEIWEIET